MDCISFSLLLSWGLFFPFAQNSKCTVLYHLPFETGHLKQAPSANYSPNYTCGRFDLNYITVLSPALYISPRLDSEEIKVTGHQRDAEYHLTGFMNQCSIGMKQNCIYLSQAGLKTRCVCIEPRFPCIISFWSMFSLNYTFLQL